MFRSSFSDPAYDDIAAWYAAWVDGESWAHRTIGHHLLTLTGDVSRSRILDVGCGEGHFSRAMAHAGADVVGVDISESMLALARPRTSSDLRITYVLDDAQTLNTAEGGEFDGAICMLALMDIPDLAATLRSVHRAVARGGWFVIGITHPCFDGPHASWSEDDQGHKRVVMTYLTEGHWVSHYAQGVRGRVGAWHRTIGTYLNTAREAGWELESMVEPASLTRDGQVVTQGADVPRILLARFRSSSETPVG